jgi:putative PIN family toxin of toxin-antitoxin system
MRVVLDANVLLSGIVGARQPESAPGAVLRAWRMGRYELITTGHLRAEVERNLTRKPYFTARLTRSDIAIAVGFLTADATEIVPTILVSGVAAHPEDDLVLAAAVSGGAEYLVTGDHQLLAIGRYEGVEIVTPRAFLTKLGAT